MKCRLTLVAELVSLLLVCGVLSYIGGECSRLGASHADSAIVWSGMAMIATAIVYGAITATCALVDRRNP